MLAEFELDRRRVELLAWQRRMKSDGRLGIERHIDFAQRFVSREIAIDARQRHLFLCRGQLDADELLGVMEQLFGDARRRRRLLRLLCQRCRVEAGSDHRGCAGGGQQFYEGAAIDFVSLIRFFASGALARIFLHRLSFMGESSTVMPVPRPLVYIITMRRKSITT